MNAEDTIMNYSIKLPPHLYERLERYAEGFDTPVNVIERILNHYEGINAPLVSSSLAKLKAPRKRDNTKYIFNNHTYGKGRLVLAVVKEYVVTHPDCSYKELLKVFSDEIQQGSTGVFRTLEEAREVHERTGHKRHFINNDETIELSDSVIAVSTEWGVKNIDNLINEAQNLGFEITRT